MATRQAKFNRSEKRRRISRGACADCGGPRGAEHYRCATCNAKRREANARAQRVRRARLKNLA